MRVTYVTCVFTDKNVEKSVIYDSVFVCNAKNEIIKKPIMNYVTVRIVHPNNGCFFKNFVGKRCAFVFIFAQVIYRVVPVRLPRLPKHSTRGKCGLGICENRAVSRVI